MIIGLDVGGTHTDVVLIGADGPIKEVKVPTDTSNLFSSVLSALEKVTIDCNIKDIKRLVLSTTLTTNAIVTGNTGSVGMIVTGGPGINPELYRTSPHYYCVTGAIDHRGSEIALINEEEISEAAEKMQNDGIKYVGVVGKFSVRNSSHETKIKNVLKDYSFEKVFIGHELSGNLNFPRRIYTTYLNASVYDIHKDFFKAVKKSLQEKGLDIPIHILKADGGTMNFESSIDFPAQTILSGPAASVMGAMALAPGKGDMVVLDIGGTTTDIAVLIDNSPVLEPLGITIGDKKTLIRSLKTNSIGIGGDSIVKVIDGELFIGPKRHGAAMAYGGTIPTPSDAFFILKDIAGGDKAAAVKGVLLIAEELGLSLEDTAKKIIEKTCEKIIESVNLMVADINSKPVYTVHELLEGYKLQPSKVLVLGGPAADFAEYLGKSFDYPVSPVPMWRVANAIGAGLARTTCEVTLFADTEKGVVLAPGEKYSRTIKSRYTFADAEKTANELLRAKAVSRGAETENIEIEMLENQSFNMVRGFRTTGQNIRIKVQVRPGLISGYGVDLFKS